MAGRILIKFAVDNAKIICQRVNCRILQLLICSFVSATYVILLVMPCVKNIGWIVMKLSMYICIVYVQICVHVTV